MKKNLANLIKVKTMVTFAVIIVFCILALRGDIIPDRVMDIVITVIAFYFGTQHGKQGGGDI
jgi:thiamine transporter ThiT